MVSLGPVGREQAVRLGRLSRRECEVLALVAEGLTNQGIAERLALSERTVEGHVRSVFLKLDLEPGRDRRVVAALTYWFERGALAVAPWLLSWLWDGWVGVGCLGSC
jgi:DNA-binding NarL/FixJ family response regulator